MGQKMVVKEIKTKKDIKKFKKFRENLYKNDLFYVSTVEFNVDMILKRETQFARSCVTKPIAVECEGRIVAECVLVFNPKDDFVQIAFFESLDNQSEAVSLIKEKAKDFAKQSGVKKITVGLNGHLSYGVGLTDGISKPNTFDST